ncbi:ABC transporter ATP-binding protein [Brucella oryzae]|uniref:ABC transporter ATP-binding protein n=1 Tax=Brucella oryzae TaxID=335286 RepID=A0A2S7J2U0_9HYPH|nr:ABC transporter ATP-binding protein [Brucella oryzae]PQA74578.1 ABC transporter ATP-binding protein [Brucella oryzae]
MKSVISVKNVSKHYAIQNEASEKFWDLLLGRESQADKHWALRDVSLEIPRGASVGLVGRNGAGKSTLLQLIAGTAEASTGEVLVSGRVAPLLELGAGFNPDFTGRENIKVAAALVGIEGGNRKQVLSQIEAFADIGDFMDRPVRTYSSGMFARLAFAVAVHVDPDILLVDEILSVGDMGFQQKCIGRLRELRERGVTLLFVSHGSDAIKSVCDRAIFLHGGKIVYDGTADQTVDRYLSFIREEMNREQLAQDQCWPTVRGRKHEMASSLRYGSGHVQFSEVALHNCDGEAARSFSLGEMIRLRIGLESEITTENLSVSFLVRDSTGVDLMGTTTFDQQYRLPKVQTGERLRLEFSFRNIFKPGVYGISVALNRVSHRDYTDNILLDQIDGAISFSVVEDADRPVHYKVWNDVEVQLIAVNGE